MCMTSMAIVRYGYSSDSTTGMLLIFTLYLISMLSIIGGYLPTWFVGRKGMNPYAGRMRAMLIYAFFPLIGLVAQPLGSWSYWFPIVIIGIIGAAHQSWSANVYSVVGDMFPKSAVSAACRAVSVACCSTCAPVCCSRIQRKHRWSFWASGVSKPVI